MNEPDKIRREWYNGRLQKLACTYVSMFIGFVMTAGLMLGLQPGTAAVIVLVTIVGGYVVSKWRLDREFKKVTGYEVER